MTIHWASFGLGATAMIVLLILSAVVAGLVGRLIEGREREVPAAVPAPRQDA